MEGRIARDIRRDTNSAVISREKSERRIGRFRERDTGPKREVDRRWLTENEKKICDDNDYLAVGKIRHREVDRREADRRRETRVCYMFEAQEGGSDIRRDERFQKRNPRFVMRPRVAISRERLTKEREREFATRDGTKRRFSSIPRQVVLVNFRMDTVLKWSWLFSEWFSLLYMVILVALARPHGCLMQTSAKMSFGLG